MAFKRGGVFALKRAKKAQSVTHTKLDSGLEISGVLSDFILEGEKKERVEKRGLTSPDQHVI